MKTVVKEWISNLTVISIMAVLVNLILPNGNMRKYVDFIFGLIILVMLLNPLLQMSGKLSRLETAIFQNAAENLSNSAAYISSQTDSKQKENLRRFLKTNLEKNLALELEYRTGLKINDINISFGESYGEMDFSSIESIHIYYTSHNGKTIQINPVEIKPNEELLKGNEISASGKIQEIRDIISDFYNIDPKSIFILRT